MHISFKACSFVLGFLYTGRIWIVDIQIADLLWPFEGSQGKNMLLPNISYLQINTNFISKYYFDLLISFGSFVKTMCISRRERESEP